jgi:hypothetical protein
MPLARAHHTVPLLWAPLILPLLGCASREMPRHFPVNSPASPNASPGVSMDVTDDIGGEAPLPADQPAGQEHPHSQTTSDAGVSADPHAHHRGHDAH